jgi:SAM-dependent methyltransferase
MPPRHTNEAREQLVADIAGTVIELGVGNDWRIHRHYGNGVTRLIGIEPQDVCARALARHRQGHLLVRGEAERLPIAAETIDHVVASFVLCSVESIERTLEEIVRVLRPNGDFRYLEHLPRDCVDGRRQRPFGVPLNLRRRRGCRHDSDPRATIARCLTVVEEHESIAIRSTGEPSRLVLGRARRQNSSEEKQ